MIVVNFKNYKQGKDVLDLAKKIEKATKGKDVVVCVPATDIHVVYSQTKLNVFAQHVNNKDVGSTTGSVTAESVKAVGASGTLLNHSEHRIPFSVLKKIMEKCGKNGLKTLVCVESIGEAKKIMRFKIKLWAIAYEDRKLIGSGKSITNYKSRKVEKFARLLKGSGIKALCGAGISSSKDVESAKELGCDGVLVASAIMKAKNVENFFK